MMERVYCQRDGILIVTLDPISSQNAMLVGKGYEFFHASAAMLRKKPHDLHGVVLKSVRDAHTDAEAQAAVEAFRLRVAAQLEADSPVGKAA